MKKDILQPCLFHALMAALVLFSAQAHAQQLDEREVFKFQVLGSNAALNKAVALEQVEDGFGTNSFITTTTTHNESTSVGTLAEITAILEGDNSTLSVTSDPVQDATGSTMTSTSDQTSTTDLRISR
jgi:hypothetical protein